MSGAPIDFETKCSDVVPTEDEVEPKTMRCLESINIV